METRGHGITAADSAYEIGGRRYRQDDAGFADAVADAHARRLRPRCMCQPGGPEMYVARLAGAHGGYIVKRMPETGSQHRSDCPSYEPPADASGLGQVLGTAIVEDPATGETTLKLDFPLTKMPGRSNQPPAGGDSASVKSDGTKLSLRAMLHYLWDQAELTRWHPGFTGKRNWGTVRRHLLRAAEHKVARGEALSQRLYIPEVFSVAQREAINARRLVQWAHASHRPGKPQQLMLLIGEVKEIVPTRYGYKAVIKHVPDQGFAIDEALYRRLGRRFEAELALWGTSDELHIVLVGTFSTNSAGVPAIQELSLMAVTREWIPVEDAYEVQLVGKLVHEGRSFAKGLRYNRPVGFDGEVALLLDVGSDPRLLRIDHGRPQDDVAMAPEGHQPPDGRGTWTWYPSWHPIPEPPPKCPTAAALPLAADLTRATG